MKIATAGFTCVDNYANLDNRHYPAGNGFDALVNLAKMGVECAVVSAVAQTNPERKCLRYSTNRG